MLRLQVCTYVGPKVRQIALLMRATMQAVLGIVSTAETSSCLKRLEERVASLRKELGGLGKVSSCLLCIS